MSLLATVNGRGLLSARPAAAAANEGYIYSASDASLYRSNGSSWDTIGSVGLADQGAFTYLDGTVAAAPSTPASGKLRVYAKTGKVLAVKDDAGVETVFGAGGSLSPVYRGRNVIGGTAYAWPASYYGLARKITASSGGDLLLSIDGYVDQTANNVGQMSSALWTDDSGTVGRLIATGVTQSLYLGGTAGAAGAYPARWFSPSFPAVVLAASTDYWIGLIIDAGANGPRIYRDAGGHDRSVNQAGAYASDGERWAQTDTTYDLSIRGLVIPL